MADTIPTTFTVPLVEYTRLATERDALAARLADDEQLFDYAAKRERNLASQLTAAEARLAECEADRLEQCRLNGMGGSREARLMARLAEAEAAIRKLYRAQHRSGTLGNPGYVRVSEKEWREVGLAFQEVINARVTDSASVDPEPCDGCGAPMIEERTNVFVCRDACPFSMGEIDLIPTPTAPVVSTNSPEVSSGLVPMLCAKCGSPCGNIGLQCDAGWLCQKCGERLTAQPAVALDDGYCESCDGDRCTAGPLCVATSHRAPPLQVQCARCGIDGTSETFMVEEGDEWECPACWERCEAQERATSPTDAAP